MPMGIPLRFSSERVKKRALRQRNWIRVRSPFRIEEWCSLYSQSNRYSRKVNHSKIKDPIIARHNPLPTRTNLPEWELQLKFLPVELLSHQLLPRYSNPWMESPAQILTIIMRQMMTTKK